MAPIATLENATIETKERKIRNVTVELYHGWVMIADGEEMWVPRDRVIDVVG
ncbi:hypothetical protein [Natrononativus amylolyticus]|uniref:hypothetical protein n=1 Tax=Natrononativus amylolyticus TaxID=2963434 RepID=UPI0020CDB1D8|nr:hypothetical protein [Natrononativus amylolyticus]